MKSTRCINLALVSANLLLAAAASQWLGCASAPSADQIKSDHSYQPEKAARQIDAGGARILYAADFAYGANTENFWGKENQGAFKQAFIEIVEADLSHSDLFINTGSSTELAPTLSPAEAAQREKASDYELHVKAVLNYIPESAKTEFNLTLDVVDVQSGTVIKSYYADSADGVPQDALKLALSTLKKGFMDDFAGEDFKRVCEQSAHPDPADLDYLLVAKDLSVPVGRTRNRALIAANTVTLPGILQSKKTADLVAIKVKMEQVIFDLTHEAEVAKEQAESQAAAGQNAGELREQSLVYNERIEILKPMLAALKEEIANRGK
jgi:hypothetical protein